MNALRVGSLFAGIGGFDLGLERAGMRVVWQCESDDFCRRVLAKHWPNVPRFEDVRDLRGTGRDAVPRVDVLCGGFPCQDISLAGRGAGIAGARSGLWSEYARLVGELRPSYVMVENVAALLGRGLSVVLGDLAALGYDAEWDCLPASAFGAPHRRDRLWLVAYPHGDELRQQSAGVAGRDVATVAGDDGSPRPLAHADSERWDGRWPTPTRTDAGAGGRVERGHSSARTGLAGRSEVASGTLDMADTDPDGRREGLCERAGRDERPRPSDATGCGEHVRDADREGQPQPGRCVSEVGRWTGDAGWWSAEPDVRRMAHGVPARLDRLRSLGNALVPQIAEWIGRRIVAYERGIA